MGAIKYDGSTFHYPWFKLACLPVCGVRGRCWKHLNGLFQADTAENENHPSAPFSRTWICLEPVKIVDIEALEQCRPPACLPCSRSKTLSNLKDLKVTLQWIFLCHLVSGVCINDKRIVSMYRWD